MWAGVRRPAWFDLTRSDSQEMTFVVQDASELSWDGRVIAPVPKASPNATAWSLGFERGEVFSTDQSAVIEQREQDQQIRRQVGKLTIAPFIFLPASLDLFFVEANLFLPARKMSGQGNVLLVVNLPGCLHQLHIALPTGFEAVNLPAQAGLSAIQASRVGKNRAAHPGIRFVAFRFFENGNGNQRSYSPVKAEHAGVLFEGRDILRRDFQDQIEDGEAAPIVPSDFAQGWRHGDSPLVKIPEHCLRPRDLFTPLSPDPFPLCGRWPEASE